MAARRTPVRLRGAGAAADTLARPGAWREGTPRPKNPDGFFASLGITGATIAHALARAAAGLVWLYQKTVSPALAVISPSCGCRFAPTCSQYARAALQEHGLLAGLLLTARRVVKCGPWHRGGFDPVPRRAPVCVRMSAPASPVPRTRLLPRKSHG